MRRFLLGITTTVLIASSSTADADWESLYSACDTSPELLICRVSDDLDRDAEEYRKVRRALEDPAPLGFYEEDFYRLIPRLLLADGDLLGAAEFSRDTLAPSVAAVIAPLPPLVLEAIPDPLVLDEENASDWAKLTTARALAAAGETDRARAAFRLAVDTAFDESAFDWNSTLFMRSSGRYFFSTWAAAGFADDALAFAATLDRAPQAWAKFYIAEGLAMRGDVERVSAVVSALPGDMPVLGKSVLAEAYRQEGEPQTALRLLDQTVTEIEEGAVGVRDKRALRRIAIGYALLGDLETVEHIMARVVSDPDFPDYQWRTVAPAVACHDPELALALISRYRSLSDSDPYTNPEATVEVLISAAASGHGAFAYAFAKTKQHLTERLLYLLAVGIGLLEAADVPADAIPCSTLKAIPTM